MHLFQLLKSDHDMQRLLCEKLLRTSADSRERYTTFLQLLDEMQSHATVEERYFYIPLTEHQHAGHRARNSLAEHQELDALLDQLCEMDCASTSWTTQFRYLADRLQQHLNEEEEEMFSLAEQSLGEEAISQLSLSFNEKRRDSLD